MPELLPAAEIQRKFPRELPVTRAKNGVTKNRKIPALGIHSDLFKRWAEAIDEKPPNSPVSKNGTAGKPSKHNSTASLLPTGQPGETLSQSYGDKYRDVFELQYGCGNYITVAQKINPIPDEPTLVAIKKLGGDSAEAQLKSIKKIRHGSFLACHDVFRVQDFYIITFEFLQLSLGEIVGNPRLDELKLASILGQVCQLHILTYP